MLQQLFFLAILIALSSSLNYSNPLVITHPDNNTPDPGAIYDNGLYYVATTTTADDHNNKFPIHSSKDLVKWKLEGYIFPADRKPSWTKSDFWAPEIHQLGPSHYVAYYAARDKTGVLCVGAAHSKAVVGPFEDLGHPLVRNASVGNIDPTFTRDSAGAPFLVWKEDGNGASPPEKYTPIWAQRLDETGLILTGQKVEILANNPNSWEGPLVEGPWIIKNGSYFYLFYSANGYASDKYAIGVARSRALLGPYEKNPANPIIHSDSHWSGPGHCSVLSVQNQEKDYFFLYHSWVGERIGGGYPRVLMMDNIHWDTNGWPFIRGSVPSYGFQPVPS